MMNRLTKILWLLMGVAGLAMGGCAAHPWTPRLTLPARYTVLRDQLAIHSDFPLAANHRLVTELVAVRADLRHRLGIPSSEEPILIYLFENADELNGFVHLYHPEFPARRAFFLETDTRLQIYAQWGDRIGEDLRHEVTHGYLHASVPNLPLWLDEGIAEYYEVPRSTGGMNRTDLECLATGLERRQWRPDLARMEHLEPTHEMTQEEYSEAWAWVHFLLETRREHRMVLREYLEDLRRFGSAEPLAVRLQGLVSDPERALIAYVGSLAAGAQQPAGDSP
jgi:hypothetical protein